MTFLKYQHLIKQSHPISNNYKNQKQTFFLYKNKKRFTKKIWTNVLENL